MKRFFLSLGAVIVLLIGILIFNTVRFIPVENAPATDITLTHPDGDALATQLAEAITFKTIDYETDNSDKYASFTAFQDWLMTTYPLVFEKTNLVRLNTHTLLLRLSGQNAPLPPVLFSAHYDVVPINPGTENDWTHPPFGGVITNGEVWGRGALDDKNSVVTMMASMTSLLEKNFIPQRDIFIALTHDEEIGSTNGAIAVTQWFRDNNITPAWSLDEGSYVLDGIVPGINKGIASINLSEKGYLTLTLTAKGEGGHSSMPPQDTAVSILAAALMRLHDAPLPGGLEGISEKMYTDIARHMDFTKRLLFANMWLFKPLLNAVVGSTNSGNAMLHTTTAPTMLSGSVKSNVLPATATATINFRLHPRDSVKSVTQWVREAINDDRVTVEAVEFNEPSPVASSSNEGFLQMVQTTRAVYPDAIITPGLTIAATDSRFYSEITDSYRFTPMVLRSEDLGSIHGTNEKISIENLVKAVQFYTALMAQQ